MKKIIAIFLGLSIGIAASGTALAQSPAASVSTDSESSNQQVSGMNRVVWGDADGPHFYAGDTVAITDNLVGDVYVGGGTVVVEGTIDGDLIVGGGTVTINGDVLQDIRAAGGNIIINGTVGQSVTIGGGNVSFGPTSAVGGSVIAGAGTLNFDGAVNGDVWMGGGTVRMNGQFGQDIHAEVGVLNVMPTASISGTLAAQYSETADVSSEASIAGQTQINQSPHQEQMKTADGAGKKALAVFEVTAKATATLMSLVSGLVLLFILPRFTEGLAVKISEQPLTALGWGLVELIVIPVVAMMLMMTVVGVPLGVLLLLLYVVKLMIATWIAAQAVGVWIGKRFDVVFLRNRYWQFIIGLALLKLVMLIPLVGGIVKLGALLMGLGTLFMWMKSQVRAGAKS